jgi:hypothetical protein
MINETPFPRSIGDKARITLFATPAAPFTVRNLLRIGPENQQARRRAGHQCSQSLKERNSWA